MSGKISNRRKFVYYLGMMFIIIGFLMFLSNFIFITFEGSPFGHKGFFFRRTSPFLGFDSIVGGFAIRGVSSFTLIIIGGVLMIVGRAGLAGSGIILDPERAREDLKPWNRVKGGMINDTLNEIDVVKTVTRKLSGEEAEPVIKVRCSSCRTLNDEDAKFCKNCGKSL
ncbi:hypothetical protein BBF96_01130 [Anoxybacter fermentans]|uniref:Zinc-ribbon domain-containing protein n=1 Tax=Anoxybacter fermentans TaxID=1323375 RepID=A0A3Q9HNI4_9FIRM|nr:zinc ribbon domain-containing protein [Anoxybacter fermentans]AZR72116.1 hypothetical protein BBF96_01130 [Anoxybacter fermentans]